MHPILGYLIVLGLGAAPILEVRAGVIFGIGAGLNPFLVLILASVSNIAALPVAFAILRHAHLREWLFRIFKKHTDRHMASHGKRFESFRELMLMIFVALPLPITGGYLAVLISELLGWNWKKSFIAISIGTFIAGVTALLGAEGVIHLIRLF